MWILSFVAHITRIDNSGKSWDTIFFISLFAVSCGSNVFGLLEMDLHLDYGQLCDSIRHS